MMRYLDVCSGISAPTQAWKPLGWECAGYFEIDPFACEVLAAHYPDVPNYGDLLKVDHDELKRKVARIDVVVGGTACQGFSVAGKRGGLADPRSNLLFAHFALARAVGARWLVWENVPGVLSDDGGRTFRRIVSTLDDLGYCCAWRVLDARFFGVPQRRRRVFIVGYLGDWRPPAAVLFEPESLRRDSSTRGKAGASVARCLANGSGSSGYRCDGDTETLIPQFTDPIQHNEGRTYSNAGNNPRLHNVVAHTLRADGFDASEDGTGRRTPIVASSAVMVRRLTPTECEFLQGMPRDFTLIERKGKPAADGPRYKALGNSMAVPVMRWIGERLAAVDALWEGLTWKP